MAFKLRAAVVGGAELVAALNRLDAKVRRRVCRKAATKGAQALIKHAKSLCPKRVTFERLPVPASRKTQKLHAGRFQVTTVTDLFQGVTQTRNYDGGLLRKSLGYKVKYYTRTGSAVAICGPRSRFRVQIGVVSRGPRKGQPVFANPQKYAHLVELGTRHSGARPFLKPAGRTGLEVTLATLRSEIAAAMREEDLR